MKSPQKQNYHWRPLKHYSFHFLIYTYENYALTDEMLVFNFPT